MYRGTNDREIFHDAYDLLTLRRSPWKLNLRSFERLERLALF